MDHLERLKEGNSVAWKYPDIESTQILFNDWVIPVTVVEHHKKRTTYEI